MTTYGADGVVNDTPLTDEIFEQENQPGGELVSVAGQTAPPAEPTDATAVAVKDEVKAVALAEQWPHDYLNFEGDKLEVRLPSEQALSAFSIGVSKYMPAEVQNDMVGLFIAKHLSPGSYSRVFARMMDPDDTTYTNQTIGQLMSSLSRAAMEARKALSDAKADAG